MNKPTIAGTVPDNGPLTSEIGKIRIWFFLHVENYKVKQFGHEFLRHTKIVQEHRELTPFEFEKGQSRKKRRRRSFKRCISMVGKC